MVPNHGAVSMENPQMPLENMQIDLDEAPPPSGGTTTGHSKAKTSSNSVNVNVNTKMKCYNKMPSWREISPSEPDFSVAILVDDVNIKDRHVSALSKPASRCYLTNIVVLNTSTSTKTNDTNEQQHELENSVQEWLKLNRVDVDVEDVFIAHGKEGYEEMLKEKEVDAVYVLVSPRYVLYVLLKEGRVR
jgi:dihydrofolate reductase